MQINPRTGQKPQTTPIGQNRSNPKSEIVWTSEVRDTGIQYTSEVRDHTQEIVTAEVVEPGPEIIKAEVVKPDPEIITAEVVEKEPEIHWLGPVQYSTNHQAPEAWLIV